MWLSEGAGQDQVGHRERQGTQSLWPHISDCVPPPAGKITLLCGLGHRALWGS